MLAIYATLTRFLTATYHDGGRGEVDADGRLLLDCWGLVRLARVELYGLPLLASRGGQYQADPAGFTQRYREQIAEMAEVTEPRPGTVIAVLRGAICTHVALVIHDVKASGLGLHVLEINPGRGCQLWPLYQFLEANARRAIRYYDDQQGQQHPCQF